MNDRKVYDYNSFSSVKKKNVNFETDMTFTTEVRYIDLDIHNRPKEMENINSIECEIDYGLRIITGDTGINDIEFSVSSIELEIIADDELKGNGIEYEIDILPGRNIPIEKVVSTKGDIIIPSDPTRVEIDMGKSMNPKDFNVTVFFGRD